MKPKITKEELELINSYKNQTHQRMNQLLVEEVESAISLRAEMENNEYTKENFEEDIQGLKTIYTTLIKNAQMQTSIFYKATNIAEVDKWKKESLLHHFLVVKKEECDAQNELSSNWTRPVIMQIEIGENVPFFEWNKKDILLAPFTKVVKIEENAEKVYQVTLELQELESLSQEENKAVYESILSAVEEVNKKLKICEEFDEENTIHYENIRKLEQLLANHHFTMEQEKYEEDTTEAEKQSDLEDIARINLELTSLKEKASQIFKLRKENADFIADWKKDVLTYLKDEFRQIREREVKEETKEKQANTEVITPEQLAPEVACVKSEVLEDISIVNTLLNNIKELIAKQQNHARIAEAMDSNYKALNNAFEMRNFAEELEALLQAISNKIDTMSPEKKEELEKVSKVNLQVSILLNYLNNAKTSVGKKIGRFDEIIILEENELKREIAETIKNIRCEAELKKLRDDVEIIEDKTKFQKFIGKFTGRNKLDETMLKQIEIRQTAIRKTFKTKMPLSYNYSIHELIAEIEMFIEENEDDELVSEDTSHLRKIKEVLKKNFVISDGKVRSIVDQKTGKNLPLTSQKISKKELIEIDTYRFLNRYGYDKTRDRQEPEYQDTLSNEIKRIIDYIKTSDVL